MLVSYKKLTILLVPSDDGFNHLTCLLYKKRLLENIRAIALERLIDSYRAASVDR
jgi:molybdopterin-guanine dinucleotide biosynthesis protein A